MRYIKRFLFAWRCKVIHDHPGNSLYVEIERVEYGCRFNVTDYTKVYIETPEGINGFLWYDGSKHGLNPSLCKQRIRLARIAIP